MSGQVHRLAYQAVLYRVNELLDVVGQDALQPEPKRPAAAIPERPSVRVDGIHRACRVSARTCAKSCRRANAAGATEARPRIKESCLKMVQIRLTGFLILTFSSIQM